MEATQMKPISLIGTGVLFLLLGSVVPTYAQDQHEQDAKPAKQDEKAKPEKKQEAKPAKQEQQAKPEKQQEAKAPKQEQQAKPEKQQEAKAPKQEHEAKPAKQQEAKAPKQEQQHQAKGQQPAKSEQHAQPQGNWARSGQKDNRGHEYNESRFGREHHARFEENGGRFYNGRREYSYGGYWFYAGAYPPWFYGQEVYFIMGADGLWYAVAYDDPSLMFQVDID
jgi:hypothetical protein